jgi:hypothetical protein
VDIELGTVDIELGTVDIELGTVDIELGIVDIELGTSFDDGLGFPSLSQIQLTLKLYPFLCITCWLSYRPGQKFLFH